MTSTLPELAPDLSAVLDKHADRLDLDLIDRALRFSASAHRGQKRMSGEDFVSHSIAVALILAEQLLDSATISAALLHDVVEDSDVRTEDIAREFGGEIAGIVDGLTKISSLTFRSTAEEQVENYRKLLLSIAKDARVIIIKLGDRLHNMRTLEHLPPERRHRIAMETREIYAPLAHRFGMAGIKAELEDLAFKFLEPDDYRDLVSQVASKKAAREQTILKLRTPLEYELKRAGIEWFEVTGRPKNLWSIFQKMRKRNKGFDEIYDLMAIRAIVRTVPECYHVLGVIHHNWTPIQERIKDYIASPKSNAYQSLHTTIFGPGGQLFEVQIRTQEMHRTAEFGIAAHWLYKRDGKSDELDQHLGWFRQLLELQQDTHSPEEFLEFLKVDLYQDEIFIFTPQGDVKRLPKGLDADRFRLPRAHRGRSPLPGRQDQRPDRAAAPRAQERRHGRDPHQPLGQAEPRLAEPRAHRAGAPQDQAVDQPRGREGQPHAGQGDPGAGGAAPAARRAGRCATRARGDGALAGRRKRTGDRGGPRRRRDRPGDPRAVSRTCPTTSCRSRSRPCSGG